MSVAEPSASAPTGRRERNKQAKLARIVAAASDLFATHGVDEVTTQQIADRADIGAGTLFLYAKSKAELLLMVQNSHYAEALQRGRVAAQALPEVVPAVMALVQPIVECNRIQVDNGRTYLREMAFGDPTEPHHADALGISGQAEAAIAAVIARGPHAADAAALARVVSAVMFFSMAGAMNVELSVDEVVAQIRQQVELLLHP